MHLLDAKRCSPLFALEFIVHICLSLYVDSKNIDLSIVVYLVSIPWKTSNVKNLLHVHFFQQLFNCIYCMLIKNGKSGCQLATTLPRINFLKFDLGDLWPWFWLVSWTVMMCEFSPMLHLLCLLWTLIGRWQFKWNFAISHCLQYCEWSFHLCIYRQVWNSLLSIKKNSINFLIMKLQRFELCWCEPCMPVVYTLLLKCCMWLYVRCCDTVICLLWDVEQALLEEISAKITIMDCNFKANLWFMWTLYCAGYVVLVTLYWLGYTGMFIVLSICTLLVFF